MAYHRLTVSQKVHRYETALRMVNEGKTMKDVGEEIGIRSPSVLARLASETRAWAASQGLQFRSPNTRPVVAFQRSPRDGVWPAVVQTLIEGFGPAVIAREMQITPSRVQNWADALGEAPSSKERDALMRLLAALFAYENAAVLEDLEDDYDRIMSTAKRVYGDDAKRVAGGAA